ncbi:uncharacterized protein LOC142590127 [Dermacentor variabilis]|uniref:uncharacterized protein LOC142590127 n=1 Tax=Dermacentor variabilis TaxID=34621 RepID=UPI003F5B4E37
MRRLKEYQFYPGITRCSGEPSGSTQKEGATALICLAAEGLGALLTNTEVPKMRRVKEYPSHPETTCCMVSPRAAAKSIGFLHFFVWLHRGFGALLTNTEIPEAAATQGVSIYAGSATRSTGEPSGSTHKEGTTALVCLATGGLGALLTNTQVPKMRRVKEYPISPENPLLSPRAPARSTGLLHFHVWLHRGFGALLTNTDIPKDAPSQGVSILPEHLLLYW